MILPRGRKWTEKREHKNVFRGERILLLSLVEKQQNLTGQRAFSSLTHYPHTSNRKSNPINVIHSPLSFLPPVLCYLTNPGLTENLKATISFSSNFRSPTNSFAAQHHDGIRNTWRMGRETTEACGKIQRTLTIRYNSPFLSARGMFHNGRL